MTQARIPSPLGDILVDVQSGRLQCLRFAPADQAPPPEGSDGPELQALRAWLAAYFTGAMDEGCPVLLAELGTPFQRKVWAEVARIPRGQTRTYRQIAEALGQPSAARACAAAIARNPVLLLRPCHRVIGSDGALRGYAGGLMRKLALLRLEGAADQSVPGRRLSTAMMTPASPITPIPAWASPSGS